MHNWQTDLMAQDYSLAQCAWVAVAKSPLDSSGRFVDAKIPVHGRGALQKQRPVTIYRRFRDNGRLAPEGLLYISSWVDDKLERCYQLMETHDRALLDEWMTNWSDLVDFEVHQVITSNEAAQRIAPRL